MRTALSKEDLYYLYSLVAADRERLDLTLTPPRLKDVVPAMDEQDRAHRLADGLYRDWYQS